MSKMSMEKEYSGKTIRNFDDDPGMKFKNEMELTRAP